MRTRDEASVAGIEQSSEKAALEEAGELGRGGKTLVATFRLKQKSSGKSLKAAIRDCII